MRPDLREIVREVSTASNLDEMLAIIVRRVKCSLPVDVCAVYLTGAEADQYVLMATDGSSAASGQVRSGPQAGILGLVGERRELVVLSNATAHPRYRRAPETGDEAFDAFLGVPLIHYHNVLGVLVAWRKGPGQFGKDEMTFFVTAAAQLSKIIYEAAKVDEVARLVSGQAGEKAFIQGVQAATGVAIGTAVLLDPLAKLASVPDRHPEDRDAEEIAFRAAIVSSQEELRASSERLVDVLPSDVRELFDVYVMLLGSDSLVADTVERIRAGNWAAGSLRDTIADHARVFEARDWPTYPAPTPVRAQRVETVPGTMHLGGRFGRYHGHRRGTSRSTCWDRMQTRDGPLTHRYLGTRLGNSGRCQPRINARWPHRRVHDGRRR
jgi:phosphotransferase system enzyme I (PtsP)